MMTHSWSRTCVVRLGLAIADLPTAPLIDSMDVQGLVDANLLDIIAHFYAYVI